MKLQKESKKQSVFLIVFLMIFTCPEYSKAQKFEAGVLSGCSINKINGLINSGFFRLGVQGGIFASASIGKNSFLRIEVKYSQKGNNSIPYNSQDFNIYSQYMEASLLFGYSISRNIYTISGLSYGYLFSYKETIGDQEYPAYLKTMSKFDYSGVVGLGYHISKNLSVEARYSNSLFPIDKYSVKSGYITGNLYNCALIGLLVYKFS